MDVPVNNRYRFNYRYTCICTGIANDCAANLNVCEHTCHNSNNSYIVLVSQGKDWLVMVEHVMVSSIGCDNTSILLFRN